MKRPSAVVNGVLAVAFAGTAGLGWLAVGNPASASDSSSQTVKVSRGTVTATVSASGNLSSATSLGLSFAGSGGTVTAITVEVGDRVHKGQVLARVDASSARQSLKSAQAGLISAQAQLTTLQEGQTSAEQARDAVQLEAQEFAVDTAKASLRAAQQTLSLDTTHQNALVDDALDAVRQASSDAERQQAEQALISSQQTRDSTLLRDRQSVTTARNQVTSAELQLKSEKATLAVNSQPPTAGQLASAQAQIASARVQVAQARTAVRQTVLRAPVTGTVAAVNGSVGQESSAGASTGSGSSTTTADSSSSSTGGFVDLTDLDALQVVADVAEADTAKLKVGQPAQITFSAADVSVDGEVTSISVEDTVSNNVVTYAVTVTLADPPNGLRLGQTASVSITTGTKDDVLIAPTSAITTRGQTSTVTVRRNGTDSTVAVTTGLAGDTGTEITSGLTEGDTLVLPASTTGAGGGFTFPSGGPAGGLSGGIGGPR